MAEMWTLIIKNSSGSDVAINDLGVIITSGSQIAGHQQFTYAQLASCDELRDLVAAGTLVLNNGTSDLTTIKGVDFLKIYNLDRAKEDFYTKTQLGMDGGATIHFANLTNVPAFGASTWTEPAKARVLNIIAIAPAGVSGNFYVDTDDKHLYKHDGTGWIDQGAPAMETRLLILVMLNKIFTDMMELHGLNWLFLLICLVLISKMMVMENKLNMFM